MRSMFRRCERRPAWSTCCWRATCPAKTTFSPTGRHDEPVLADGKVQFFGQPIFAVIAETREQARRACRLAKVKYDELPAIIDIGDLDPVSSKLVTPPLTLQRGDAADGDRKCAAPHQGPDARRRAGPFLSRRPYRHGRARRGPGRHRLFLHAASERSAAHGGARARRAVARGDGGNPPNGRRLRRQGNAVEPVRGHRGDRGEASWPRGENPPRPRRRHDRDWQAARLPDRLRGRLRQQRRDPRRRFHLRRALRVFVRPFRPGHRPGAVPLRQHLFLPDRTARCRRRFTPTRFRTRRSAASAGRKEWSAPSA